MLPKLCAFDLDGTLLTTDKTISRETINALTEMDRRGITVVLASGRMVSSMIPYARQLPFKTPLITLNGACIYTDPDRLTTPIYHAPLQERFVTDLVNAASRHDVALNYYYDSHLYVVRTPQTGRWIDLYHRQTQTPYTEIDEYARFSGCSPSKIIFVGAPRHLDALAADFQHRWRDRVYVCRTWEYYLEFLDPRANKGTALSVLADRQGCPAERIMAFGDAENDIPMLAFCGEGIAMANACDAAKAAARRVLPWTNDDDGIAREWQRLTMSTDDPFPGASPPFPLNEPAPRHA